MQLLHGRYQVLEIIKSGGMGAVYEAKDTKLADSPCAIKEILEDKQNDDYFQTRFALEMKALAELDHPAIPRVRDFFRLRGKTYLVMDLVRGHSLHDDLIEKGALDAKQVVRDMLEVLDVLDYLHGHTPPMIHRDIKPANILRDGRSGRIKLVDFGLARAACGAVQTAVGTVGYCAPEQAVGRADPRSDLFSVGATMLHLISGKDPDILATASQIASLPVGLQPIVTRATHLKSAVRYESAHEMAKDLKLWQRGFEAAVGLNPAPPVQVPLAPPANPYRFYLIAVAITLALAIGVWLGQHTHSPPTIPSPVAAKSPPAPAAPVQAAARSTTLSQQQPSPAVPLYVPPPAVPAASIPPPAAVTPPPAPPQEVTRPGLGQQPTYPTHPPDAYARATEPPTTDSPQTELPATEPQARFPEPPPFPPRRPRHRQNR